MLGSLLAYMGLPRPAYGPGPLEKHQTTNTQEEAMKEAIQWITNGSAAATFLSFPYLQFFPVLPQFACNLWL